MKEIIAFGPTAGCIPEAGKTITTKSDRARYRRKCRILTEKAALNMAGSDLRKFKGGHHIDHIVPISIGYKLGIDPALICSPENLRILPESENLQKGQKLTEEAGALLAKWRPA